MNQQDRAVTPVVSTILMVAIVVILAATVSMFFFNVVENINEPGPNVADTTGEFAVTPPGENAGSKQIVRITHIAGEGVAVEELEIVVRASGPDDDLPIEGRLVNLPADGSKFDDENFDTEDADNLIDRGGNSKNNVIISDGIDVWSAGQTITFRINTGAADFREDPNGPEANELEVVIVHTPSGTIISQNTFTP